MQRVLSALGYVFRKSVLVVGLVALLSVSVGLGWGVQPSYAADSLSPGETIERAFDDSLPSSNRESARQEAYKAATEAAKTPDGLEKAYEEDLKAFKESHPDQGGLVEGAKELVEKVTNKS